MSMQRKWKRDSLKKEVGSAGLADLWNRLQRRKYGALYNFICRSSKKATKRKKVYGA